MLNKANQLLLEISQAILLNQEYNPQSLKYISNTLDNLNTLSPHEISNDQEYLSFFDSLVGLNKKINSNNKKVVKNFLFKLIISGIEDVQVDHLTNSRTGYAALLELKNQDFTINSLNNKCPNKFDDFLDDFIFAPALFANVFKKEQALTDTEKLFAEIEKEQEIEAAFGNLAYYNVIKNLYTIAKDVGCEKRDRAVFMATILFNTQSEQLYYSMMSKPEKERFNQLKQLVNSPGGNWDQEQKVQALEFLNEIGMKFSFAFSTNANPDNIQLNNGFSLGLQESTRGYAKGTIDAGWPVIHESNGETVCTPLLFHFTQGDKIAQQNQQYFLSKRACTEYAKEFGEFLNSKYFSNYKVDKINPARSIVLKEPTQQNKTTNLRPKTNQNFNALHNIELLSSLYPLSYIQSKPQKQQLELLKQGLKDIRILTRKSFSHISEITFKNKFSDDDYFTHLTNHLLNIIEYKEGSIRENKDSANVKNAITFISMIAEQSYYKEEVCSEFKEAMALIIEKFDKTLEFFKSSGQSAQSLRAFLKHTARFCEASGSSTLFDKKYSQIMAEKPDYDIDEFLSSPKLIAFKKDIKKSISYEKKNIKELEIFDSFFDQKELEYSKIIDFVGTANSNALRAQFELELVNSANIVANKHGRGQKSYASKEIEQAVELTKKLLDFKDYSKLSNTSKEVENICIKLKRLSFDIKDSLKNNHAQWVSKGDQNKIDSYNKYFQCIDNALLEMKNLDQQVEKKEDKNLKSKTIKDLQKLKSSASSVMMQRLAQNLLEHLVNAKDIQEVPSSYKSMVLKQPKNKQYISLIETAYKLKKKTKIKR